MSTVSVQPAQRHPGNELTQADLRNLRRLAGFMIPAAGDYGAPGADDEAIFTDIVRSLGRDQNDVRKALVMLRELAGEDFAALPDAEAAPAEPEVWVADGYPEYHTAGCHELNGRDAEPVPVSQAVEDGFSPCGRCDPDNLIGQPTENG